MTTDTPLLFFFALALWAQLRLARGAGVWAALLMGAAVGLGLLSKHAMLFGIFGMAGAALFVGWRPGWRNAAIAALVALIVVAPHLWWLKENSFVTARHLAESGAGEGVGLNLSGALRFLLEQAAVMGPVLYLGFWVGLWHVPRRLRGAAVAALAVLVIVTLQALSSHALANWAVAFTVPGVLVAVAYLAPHRRLMALSVGIGLAIAVALPLLTAFGTGVTASDGRPLLARYLGQGAFAEDIIGVARAEGAGVVVSDERDELSALSWAARGGDIAIRATPHTGPVRHHWDLKAPLAEGAGAVLMVYRSGRALPDCARILRDPAPRAEGFIHGKRIGLALLDEGCRP